MCLLCVYLGFPASPTPNLICWLLAPKQNSKLYLHHALVARLAFGSNEGYSYPTRSPKTVDLAPRSTCDHFVRWLHR